MLTIIGCGNATRSDDAVGVLIAQRLRADFDGALPENVRIFDAGTSGIEVMFHARGTTALIVVDAMNSDAEPGAIFEVPGRELETIYEPSFSLHDFRWDHALAAGRKIFCGAFPEDITVYLIQAGKLDFGLELTAPVRTAAEKVIARIGERIRAYGAAKA
ncbi:MAG: hydrogenase maturation protease [Gammaproteobacteria bacterium]|nr:hydrogenase maturation protease [Gammaproteobacteria bacterium]